MIYVSSTNRTLTEKYVDWAAQGLPGAKKLAPSEIINKTDCTKAVMFGVIVTFWPIYLLAISIASCYSKCFKEEEENVKNFKAKYKLSNSPTIGLLE